MKDSFHIDTNIGDFLWDEELIEEVNDLIEEDEMELLVTHIQIDEWKGISEEEKRQGIMSLDWEKLPTGAAVFGVSRFDESRFGDGSEGGLSIEVIRNKHGEGEYKHTEDSLIASTAERDADYLVSNDRRMKNQVRKKGTVEVKDKEEFKSYIKRSKEK
jgi:predicted nucleic acid-binding protein